MVIKRRLGFGLLAFLMLLVSVGPLVLAGCGSPVTENEQATVAAIWAETVPQMGTETAYGMPLSLDNTQQFIDWYHDIKLTPEEEAVKDNALDPLKAPCCDEYSLRTC